MQVINTLNGCLQHNDSYDVIQYVGQDLAIRKNTSKYGIYVGNVTSYNDGAQNASPIVFCKAIETLSTQSVQLFSDQYTQVNRAFLVLEYDAAGDLVSVLFEYRAMDGISNKRPMVRGKGTSLNPIAKTVDYEFERLVDGTSFPVNSAMIVFSVNGQPMGMTWSLLNTNVTIANREDIANTSLTLSVVTNWQVIASNTINAKMNFPGFRLDYRPMSMTGISTEEVENIARDIAATATADIFEQAKQLMDKYMVSR